ncbi:MAG: hypothetical protein E7541_02930 [Ruminococcaceae bacterium]|nr:hypothetical protein [Oscillospiraceae bacterium]
MALSCALMSRECTGCGGCRDGIAGRLFCHYCGRVLLTGEDYLDLEGEAMCEDCQLQHQREA